MVSFPVFVERWRETKPAWQNVAVGEPPMESGRNQAIVSYPRYNGHEDRACARITGGSSSCDETEWRSLIRKTERTDFDKMSTTRAEIDTKGMGSCMSTSEKGGGSRTMARGNVRDAGVLDPGAGRHQIFVHISGCD